MGTVVTADSALSVGVSSCQPEKISDKCGLSAWIGGGSEGVCRPPERRGGGVWRGYWHKSPWYTESYDFFCAAGRGVIPLRTGVFPEYRTVRNLVGAHDYVKQAYYFHDPHTHLDEGPIWGYVERSSLHVAGDTPRRSGRMLQAVGY